jgi:hypothetical protein
MSLPQPPEPYASLLREWSRSLQSKQKSPRTIRHYTDATRWVHLWCLNPAPPNVEEPETWLATLPDTPHEPDDVDVAHCRGFIAYRIAATGAGDAHNNYKGVERQVLVAAHRGRDRPAPHGPHEATARARRAAARRRLMHRVLSSSLACPVPACSASRRARFAIGSRALGELLAVLERDQHGQLRVDAVDPSQRADRPGSRVRILAVGTASRRRS